MYRAITRNLAISASALKAKKGYKKKLASRGQTHNLVSRKQGFEKERLEGSGFTQIYFFLKNSQFLKVS